MKKILIIEDDLIVRSIYRRKFEMSGYTVETAEEGAAALALLPVFKPDVIQVDIMLPGIDGVEVIRKIRSWPEFKGTPILVLSSFYRPDLAKEAWKAGANKCVSKMDCTPNLALDLVEQLLGAEGSGFRPTYGEIPLAKDALEVPTELAAPEEPATITQPDTAARAVPSTPEMAKLRVALDLLPSKGAAPSMPSFTEETPSTAAPEETKPKFFGGAVPAPYKPTTRPSLGNTPIPAPHAPPPPVPVPAPPAAPPPVSEEAPPPSPEAKQEPAGAVSGSDFRVEIRQEFLRRAPQIQAELRDRVSALI